MELSQHRNALLEALARIRMNTAQLQREEANVLAELSSVSHQIILTENQSLKQPKET